MSISKIKEIKIREEDGSYSNPIPVGADAVNIDYKNSNVENELNKLNDSSSINKTNIDNLSNQVNTNKTNIELQTSRIDNLATLEEGSTTGDAELIDARVGYNGKIYSSVGENIRNSNEDINFKINNYITISSDTEYLKRVKLDYTDKNLEKTGRLLKKNEWTAITSDYITVTPFETVYITGAYHLRSQLYAFYDRNKNPIVVYPGDESTNTITKVNQLEVIVPENATYIIISSIYTRNKYDLILERKGLINNNTLLLNTLKQLYCESNTPIGEQVLYEIKDNLTPSTFGIINDMHYINKATGNLSNHNNQGYYTDFINIKDIPFDLILTTYCVQNSCSIAYYDRNKSFLGSDLHSYQLESLNWQNVLNNFPECQYIRFCSINSIPLQIYYIENRYGIGYLNIIDFIKQESKSKMSKRENYNIEIKSGYYYNYHNGSKIPHSGDNCYYTELIPILSLPRLIYYTGMSQFETCKYVIYNESTFLYSEYNDNDKNYASYVTDMKIDLNVIIKSYPNATHIAFCSYKQDLILQYDHHFTIDDVYNEIQEIKRIGVTSTNNILYGKKYVACGDSFTEGDFTGYVDPEGNSGRNSEYLYDKEWKMYKTYPYWIAKRNNMTLINEAKCGTILPLSKEYTDGTQPENYKNPFSLNRYKAVPKDADYLTLMFGLNEGSIPIGELTDTDNTTVLGAYNKVLEYFLTEMPYTRIGIIVSDAWLSQNLHDAIIKAAQYWGIPYLDLKGNDSIPMQIGGRLNGINVNSKARILRDNAYKVTSANGHPNIESHKQRSRIIENFLRTL